MRKFGLLVLLMMAPMFLEAQTFDFEKEGNRRGWNFGGGTVDVREGNYIFEMDGTVKTPNIRKSKINADAAKYMHLVLKNNTNAVSLIKFNFKDDSGKVIFKNIEISNNDKEFVTYTLDLNQFEEWKGVRHVNLRFWNNKDLIEGTLRIDEIVFDMNNSH